MAEDAVHRATRWHAFYEEDGGIGQEIELMRRAYFTRYTEARNERERVILSLADKLLAQQDAYFRNIINSGKIAQAAQDHADKIAKLPEARRRFL